MQAVGWLIVAACGWILVSSQAGITWPFVTVAGQAPVALLVAWPVLIAAAARRAWALTTAAALVCVAHVAFVAPLVRENPRPSWVMGQGLTFSFPIGDRVPPVTRIDHASSRKSWPYSP